jgi:hypothetical protein
MADGAEEFAPSGRGGGYRRHADGWTIGGTVLAGLGVGGSLILAILWAGWYLSKADTALTNVQSDVGQVNEKVKKLADESTKHGVRLERIEGSVSKIESSMQNQRSVKPSKK